MNLVLNHLTKPIAISGCLLLASSAGWAQTNNLWLPMPMLGQSLINAAVWSGGEGCQYPQAIDIAAQDGSFILYGTDVGGMYRSINGGKLFNPATRECPPAGQPVSPLTPSTRAAAWR